MSDILVYALHDDEGVFNKNSLGAISEAARLAAETGGKASVVVVGEVADDAAAGLGRYGAAKVFRCKAAPEGLAQPIVDVMAKVITDNGIGYALFGGAAASRLGPACTPPHAGVNDRCDPSRSTATSSSRAPVLQDSAMSTSATSPSRGSSSAA